MILHKPYNSYNLFFTLERTLFIEGRKSNSVCSSSSAPHSRLSPSPHRSICPSKTSAVISGYEFIDLPPLPPRYRNLESKLPANWYIPGKNKIVKRKHTKTHGLASFKEVAKMVATNWKTIDPVTKDYVETIATILKKRHSEVKSFIDKNRLTSDKEKNQGDLVTQPSDWPKKIRCEVEGASLEVEKKVPVRTSLTPTGWRRAVPILESAPLTDSRHDGTIGARYCMPINCASGSHHSSDSIIPRRVSSGTFDVDEDFNLDEVLKHYQQRNNCGSYACGVNEVDMTDREIVNQFLSA